MRTLALSLSLIAGAPAAAAADALPPGWSQRADGVFVHEQSTIVCPAELGGLKRTSLESKGAPDLGICTYTSEQDREGLVRVREYVRGAGETPLATQNDMMLMEPPPGSPSIVAGYRGGPGPDKNGAATRQFVLTFARNKLLIDCIGRQLASDSGDTADKFPQACAEVEGLK